MRKFPALLLILAAASAAASAAATPPPSRARGERVERWRALLEQADADRDAARLAEAERSYDEVVQGTTAAAGLLQARGLDGLADVRRLQGRWAEAELLYDRSAAIWQRVLGAHQPRLATTLHHLGLVRMMQHKDEAARVPLAQALEIWERALGAESPEAEATRRILVRALGYESPSPSEP